MRRETYLESDTDGEDKARDDDAHPAASHVCDRGSEQGAKDSADGEDRDDERLLGCGNCTDGILAVSIDEDFAESA